MWQRGGKPAVLATRITIPLQSAKTIKEAHRTTYGNDS